MTRMMIEVTNEETLKLIQSLEKLHLLKVVQPARKKVVFDKSWSGSISKETADAMLAQVEKSKEEWDRGY